MNLPHLYTQPSDSPRRGLTGTQIVLITLIAIPTLCIGGCTACVLAVSMRSPNPGTFQPDHQQASSISSSNQATPKPKARKYVAEMSVEMHQSPESEAKVIGKIKEGTHLEAIAKDHHWIKVNFKGKEGWVASTLLTRVMDVPAPDLEFYSNGYKVIDRKYRYFFGISNSGLKPYKGQLTLRLLDENGVVFEEVYTFSENPILDSGGRAFSVDSVSKASRFEFKTDSEKFSDAIGQLLNN